jgi:hypothetical protein
LLFPPTSVSVALRSELRETLTNRHGKNRADATLGRNRGEEAKKQGSELGKMEAYKRKLASELRVVAA